MSEDFYFRDDHEFEKWQDEASFWNLYDSWQDVHPYDDMGEDSEFWDAEEDFRNWDDLDYDERRDLLYEMGYIDEDQRDDEDYKPD